MSGQKSFEPSIPFNVTDKIVQATDEMLDNTLIQLVEYVGGNHRMDVSEVPVRPK